jgi:hypothetical protein
VASTSNAPSSRGLVTGRCAGSATIRARRMGVSGTGTVVVQGGGTCQDGNTQ